MKPSTAKAKGSATETAYVNWLQANGVPNAERRHLSGAYDQGDIAGFVRADGSKKVCVEVKSGASLNIQGWLRELDEEIKNSKSQVGYVVVRPKGKPNPEDWFVVMRSREHFRLLEEAGYLG